MDKLIVTVFENEKDAYEGTKALQELHDEGSIGLYARAVITKHAAGGVDLQDADDYGPMGAAVGMLVGSIVGLVGGPVGVAVGASSGAMAGSIGDLQQAGVDAQFLADVSEELTPGKSAVVAEVAEGWTTPLTSRMEELGGTVLRRRRSEVEDEQVQRSIAAHEAELQELKQEWEQASDDAKAKLKSAIEGVEAKLNQAIASAADKAKQLEEEAAAKVATIEGQISKASDEVKAKFKKHLDDIRSDYARRVAKLQQAGKCIADAVTIC